MFKSPLALLTLMLLSLPSQARDSLCTKEEQIAFSCTVGRKLVSLCASPDLSKTTGYVQYRYGQYGKLEMSYPQLKTHPGKVFRWGVIGFSGGGADYFRFANDGYDYVVYSGFGKGWSKEGVVVEKGGKRLQSLVCKDEALDADNWKVMYSAGIPQIEGANDFDMP